MTGVPLLRRQVRAEPVVLAAVALLVVALAFLAAAVPRAATQTADDAVRQAALAAPAQIRQLSAQLSAAPGSADVLDQLRTEVRAGLPRAVAGFVGAGRYTISTDELPVSESGATDHQPLRDLTVRLISDWPQHVRFVSGSADASPAPDTAPDTEPNTTGPPTVGIALSKAVADGLGAGPGSVLVSDRGLRLRVTGVFEPRRPDSTYWLGQDRALTPVVVTGPMGENPTTHATALITDTSYTAFVGGEGTYRLVTTLTFPFDADRLTDADVPAVQAALARIGSAGVAVAYQPLVGSDPLGGPDLGAGGPGFVQLQSGLAPLLDRYRQQRTAALSIVSVELVTVAVLGCALLALLAQLLARRRELTGRLLTARGVSGGQQLGNRLAESAVLLVPAAGVGLGLALVLVAGRLVTVPIAAAAALAVLAVAVLTVAALTGVDRAPRRTAHGRRSAGRAARALARLGRTGSRYAGELLVGLLAIGVGVVLWRRSSNPADHGGLDPLFAAAPVVLLLVGGVIVVRAYRYPIGLLAGWARRGRRLVGFVGTRLGSAGTFGGALPVLVVLLSTGSAVFSGVLVTTVQQGQDVASYRQVGADVRLDGFRFQPDQIDTLAHLPGVRAAAGVYTDTSVTLTDAPRSTQDITVWALPGAGAHLLTGTSADPKLPASLFGPVAPGQPLPAVVSPEVAAASTHGRLSLRLAGTTVDVAVLDVVDSYPGIPTGRPLVLVPLPALRAVTGQLLVPTVVLLRAPGVTAAQVQAATDARLAPLIPVTSRADVLSTIRASELVTGTVAAFRLSLLAAAIGCPLAVALTMIATSRERYRVLALLRTLGLTDREAGRLIITEVGPALLVAVLGGAILGLVVPRAFLPAVDLTPLTGGSRAPSLSVDVGLTLVIVAATAVLTVVAVLVSALAARRRQLGAVVRVGAGP